MSAEQLEILRALNRAFNSGGDWPSFYAADAELHMPADWPDDPVYYGLDGLHAALGAWRGGFDEYHWREERLIDAGDDRVVGLYYHRGRDEAGRRLDRPGDRLRVHVRGREDRPPRRLTSPGEARCGAAGVDDPEA